MSNLTSLIRVFRSRLAGLLRSPVDDSDHRRQMKDLHRTTEQVLADYKSGKITAEELRDWLAKNDPGNPFS